MEGYYPGGKRELKDVGVRGDPGRRKNTGVEEGGEEWGHTEKMYLKHEEEKKNLGMLEAINLLPAIMRLIVGQLGPLAGKNRWSIIRGVEGGGGGGIKGRGVLNLGDGRRAHRLAERAGSGAKQWTD